MVELSHTEFFFILPNCIYSRYYSLIDKSIGNEMVSPLEQGTIQGIYKFVPTKLRLDNPEAAKDFFVVSLGFSLVP